MKGSDNVFQYYDTTVKFYQKYWYRQSKSYALHYGFWDATTKNIDEAFLNTNKFLAEKANIQATDIVLDAGCGVGGSTIWIAKTIGAKAIGITISEVQIKEARRLAEANQVDNKVEFQIQDYCHTDFLDESFDVVWAIESVCHAEDKALFLKEAFRLLKKGGRFVIADGFKGRDVKSEEERQFLETFQEGLAIPNIAFVDQFKSAMESVGFKDIKFWDKTKDVLPSARKLYFMCKYLYPVFRFLKRLKGNNNPETVKILDKNSQAGVVQYELLKVGLGCYGVFSGEKS